MSATKNTAPVADQLAARLDELATLWMVDGPGSLTEQRLIQLAALAQKDPAFAEIAKRANALANDRSKGKMVAEEPFTAFQRLMRGEAEPVVQAPAPAPAAPAAAQTTAAVAMEEEPMEEDEVAFDDDPEMLAGFVTESQEHLAAIEEQILALERDPSQLPAVHAVFRAFHTIKGLAGFLGLKGVQGVAHEVETLLDHARNSRVQISVEIVDLVLESSEYLQAEVNRINGALNGADPGKAKNNRALLRTIATVTQRALEGGATSEPAAVEKTAPVAAPAPAPVKEETPAALTPKIEAPAAPAPVAKEDEPVAPAVSASTAPKVEAAAPAPAPKAEISVPAALELKAEAAPTPATAQKKVEPEPAAAIAPQAAVNKSEPISASIRIDTAKLDQLMDMVGEMVIAQSILSHNPIVANNRDARLIGDLAQLARITGEVQRRAMNIRMMPIGPLFQKNAKLVRDLSRRHGKQVELLLAGEGTELDKTIAEELSDPLLHMIRNALDHGIETPQERAAAGKNPTATLRLSAEHESGKIVVSISDDGRGLNPDKIFRKALERGLVTEDTQLTETEIFQLIFSPGFSTAEKITDISGRGVGMDVVRKHVENLRGHIQIESELGKGTTFYIHLPLTLAIIEGLVIVVGDHRYIIPVFSVREMLRPTPEMLVRVQGTEEMILMRGNLYPLVRLHRRFGIKPRSEDICQGLVVVCEGAGRQFCLHVDDLLGRQEIVIKSLGETFSDNTGLTGCAILGDGRIGLILDVVQIFKMPNETGEEAA
ncbi:chemotaxis protein CheA [Terriglobus albidus]|uniref:chemotaxis protein CheA n=1 Tax=Terriglobus albidus TaxID=1592106 RepID=UPI0021E08667|nr:chemotaxis protein CheA [Terriglobus albidus]